MTFDLMTKKNNSGHLLLILKPFLDNVRAVGAEVAGTGKKCLAVLDMTENLASLCVQFNF
jgi:hypothetical protein